jgi:hypothetical protein
MRLWEFQDQYIVEPTDGTSTSCLAISRADGSMNITDEVPHCNSARVPKIQTVFGIVGMLKLLAGSYLLVITESDCVGSYLGHPIFKITSLKVLPCDLSLKNSLSEQKKMEAEFSALLNITERTTGLYYSYDVNLTLSAQRLHDLGNESKLLPLFRQADQRFLWNNYMLEPLVENKLDPFILPVIQGSFNNFKSTIGKDTIDVTLIARRCTRRNGTRMWRRGADSDGYVANFVESEQIVQLNGFTASFVQVRGSIPILWNQIVDLTYKPKFEIVNPEQSSQVAERHFLDLRKKYGNVIAVDLVNTQGGEGRLCAQFAKSVQPILSDEMRYVHFDFHHICGHVHFERLSILYEQIEDFLKKNRYLLLNEKGDKLESQLGVVRSNCIDCLDRTNVTQSMIGRKMLEEQLRRIGTFTAEETISSHKQFDDFFKVLWANHGDEISIQYSGTPALKGDFVRNGVRSTRGILNDGYYSLMRYYLNNFVDGTKQDAIDLIQGNYIIAASRDLSPPPKKLGIEAIASFPIAFSIIIAGFFFTVMSLKRVPNDASQLLISLMWAGMSLGLASVVKSNGRIFCNRPRLQNLRFDS